MASKVYDFTLPATLGASQRFDVRGNYVKLVESTGAVIVKAETGEEWALLAGQGFRLPESRPFGAVTIRNATGSACVGTLFIGDSFFEDSRIAGNVGVIDSSSSDVLSGTVAEGTASYTAPTAGRFSRVQMWNPANSGVFSTIEEIVISIGTTGSIYVSASTVSEATVWNQSFNRRINSPNGKTEIRTGEKVGINDDVLFTFRSFLLSANQIFVMAPKHPYVMLPGQGLSITAVTAANIGIALSATSVEKAYLA